MKKALITGITGQDGSFLAELLLNKGYEVHGIIRRSSSFNTERIDHIYDDIHLHYGDMTDSLSLERILHIVKPDELYNLAAQSHVKVSFDIPDYTGQVDAMGTLRLLEGVRTICPQCRVYNACTSEMYGLVQEPIQNEKTPFYPRSPYGVAKLYSFWIAKNYRESYGLFVSNGILFNHESERRGETFVTRKITKGLGKIYKEIPNEDFFTSHYVEKERRDFTKDEFVIELGNLDAKRDWGYAKDYVWGMWLMLQHSEPDDFVLSTGEVHSVREFIEQCIKYMGFNIVWEGEGVNEVGKVNGRTIIKINPKYYRPAEVDFLLGDYTKAKEKLGWEPDVKFEELVKIMMLNDVR